MIDIGIYIRYEFYLSACLFMWMQSLQIDGPIAIVTQILVHTLIQLVVKWLQVRLNVLRQIHHEILNFFYIENDSKQVKMCVQKDCIEDKKYKAQNQDLGKFQIVAVSLKSLLILCFLLQVFPLMSLLSFKNIQ